MTSACTCKTPEDASILLTRQIYTQIIEDLGKKPGDVQHTEVGYLSSVYKFLMPDHGGADTTHALSLLGADKSQKKETYFLDKKRGGLKEFIIRALAADSSIGWTDLAVNSAIVLL